MFHHGAHLLWLSTPLLYKGPTGDIAEFPDLLLFGGTDSLIGPPALFIYLF